MGQASETKRTLNAFIAMWSGQAVSLFGSRLVQFALIWWLTQETGSATVLATASLVGLLPQVLLGTFAGAVVDRWNRRRIMMLTDSLVALATLLLAYLFISGRSQIEHVYVILFVRAVAGSLQRPALMASTTLMVPKESLARIQGLNQMLEGGLNIATAPLGAFLLGVMPIQGILAIDVFTAIIAVGSLLFIFVPQPQKAAATGGLPGGLKPSFWSDMRAGFRYFLGWPGLLMLGLLATLLNLLLSPALTMLPLLVTQHFQGGAIELGWLESAVGVGIIAGGLVLGVWGGFKRRILTSMISLVLLGGSVVWLGVTPADKFPMAVAAILLMGVTVSMANGPINALFQSVVAPEMQGRIMGLTGSVSMAATPLGLLIAGPLADAIGVRNWIIGAGFLVTAVSLVGFLVPSLMQLEENSKTYREAILDSAAPGLALEEVLSVPEAEAPKALNATSS